MHVYPGVQGPLALIFDAVSPGFHSLVTTLSHYLSSEKSNLGGTAPDTPRSARFFSSVSASAYTGPGP